MTKRMDLRLLRDDQARLAEALMQIGAYTILGTLAERADDQETVRECADGVAEIMTKRGHLYTTENIRKLVGVMTRGEVQ